MNLQTNELHELETVIERGLNGFYEAGQALKRIREERLYKRTYRSFEDYCQQRWNFNRAHAYRLIIAVQIVDNLQPMGTVPATERQARPLSQLPPAQQVEAWQTAQAIGGSSPSYGVVERAVKAIGSPRQSIEPGQRLTVTHPKSPFYGQEVEVLRIDGVIAMAQTGQGEEPFLVSELIPTPEPEPELEPESGASRNRPRTDRLEAIEAMLDAERERVHVLESVLKDLVAAAEVRQVNAELLFRARRLIGS